MKTARAVQLAVMALTALVLSLGHEIKTVSAAPAPYASPLGSCVEERYVGSEDVLAFTNGCSEQAHVFFYANSNIYGGIHVGVGETEKTGYSRAQLQRAGGIASYSCPEGYTPYDENDQLATSKRVSRYRCKY